MAFLISRFLLVAHVMPERHGLHHAIGFQLPVHLADRVAVQPVGIASCRVRVIDVPAGMPRCDGKTDLVVELRMPVCRFPVGYGIARRWDRSECGHIRSELPGDNWGCVLWACDNVQLPWSAWVELSMVLCHCAVGGRR